MSETILAACEPNRDRLLALVSEAIDDSMLQEIAEADYGRDVEEYLPALKQIRDKGKMPVPLGSLLQYGFNQGWPCLVRTRCEIS